MSTVIDLELTDEGKMTLRCDLAYFLTHEAVEEYDGIENYAICAEAKLEPYKDGLAYFLPAIESRTEKTEILFFADEEVQEI